MLTREQAVRFRDELRAARAAAHANSEGYQEILFILERFGSFLSKSRGGLKKHAPRLASIGGSSSLANELPSRFPELHRSFSSLFDTVREARNDALHTGSFARHLTQNAIDLTLCLEDALNQRLRTAADFMVPSPVVVEDWQPVSYARHLMLLHSFSFLPCTRRDTDTSLWYLIEDVALARYLGGPSSPRRHERMRTTVFDAWAALRPSQATMVKATAAAEDVLKEVGPHPVLVAGPVGGQLAGIVTAFDLL